MNPVDIDFKTAFEAMPGVSALLDIDDPVFTIITTTDDYLKPSGRPKEMVAGKGIFEVFPKSPNDPNFWGEQNLRASFTRVLQSKTTDRLPIQRYDIPDAQNNFHERYWQATNTPILDTEGNVRYIAHSAEDVTDKIKVGQQEEKIKGYQQAYNLFMQAPVGICILRCPDFVVDLANDPFLQILQKDKTILGKTILQVLPEIDGQGLVELLKEVAATGKPYAADEAPVVLNRSGVEEIVHFNFIYQPYYEGDANNPVGVLVLCTDVSDKVAAVKKSEESERLNRLLIEESTVAMAMYVGRELKIQYVNDVMLRYWGKDDSVLGKTLKEAVPELIGQPYLGFFDEVYTSGIAHVGSEDEVSLHVDGKLQSFYYNYTYKALKDTQVQVYGIHHMAIDVTEQVLAKKALKKSEYDFRQLADTLPEMVWTTDAAGNQTFASKRWKEFTGLDPYDEATFQEIIHPDDSPLLLKLWSECLKTGSSYISEVRIKNKNSEYQWFYVDGECIRNDAGTIEKWVGAFTNINEQKIAQAELQAALSEIQENEKRLENTVKERTHDLSEAKKFLEENNATLQAMNKELESFAYISSHDLQEPLRKIQTFASRIMETDLHRLSPDGKTYFERIQNAGLRMQTLIDDLLAYSRTNTEARRFEKISLGQIIEEIKEDIYEDLEVYNATIETIDICDVHIISFQFRQLMHNLIGNALKFSKHDSPPHIVIKCHTDIGKNLNRQLHPDRKYCHIAISDNGIGFEPEYGERIFEVFQRLHGKDKYNGTGIGLAIVKKIIENHEGIITATGELGKGAIFDIYIPSIDEVIIL